MGFDKRGGGENWGGERGEMWIVGEGGGGFCCWWFGILNVRTEWWWGGERGVRRTGICWALG